MPQLILMDARGQVRQIPIALPSVSLGRSPSSDVVLDSKRASRAHAVIEVDGPKVFIIDMHSLNGTLVNGELIDRHQLAHGDSIEIGTVELRYVAQDQVLSEDEAMRLLTAPTLDTSAPGWDDWDYETERADVRGSLLQRSH
ncbi:FHA domain-containing protein [Variovorax sp. OV329]|uniref:FHA domain-containing protein n=1 Tax=Variovorax sp. OV329 TaxID=1882825 RepID=UPI0008EE4777|nr:FHA domain-containing protein [Variovorax sp. OV329]SFM82226.1 FHA domain-containing protein [Variovorax sp. OV329]